MVTTYDWPTWTFRSVTDCTCGENHADYHPYPWTFGQPLAPLYNFGATERAYALLEAELSPEQLAEWRTQRLIGARYFTVTSQSGRRYRLYDEGSQNIVLLNRDGMPWLTYCIVFQNGWDMPVGDLLLAQMLLLQTREKYARTKWISVSTLPDGAWHEREEDRERRKNGTD